MLILFTCKPNLVPYVPPLSIFLCGPCQGVIEDRNSVIADLAIGARVMAKWSYVVSIKAKAGVRVWVRVRYRVRTIFERRSGNRTRAEGVCDFEKVPPNQLCPRAKRD